MNAIYKLQNDDSSSVASLDLFGDPLNENEVDTIDESEFNIPEFTSDLPTLEDVLAENFDFSPSGSPSKLRLQPKHERYGSISSFGSYDSIQPAFQSASSSKSAELSIIKHIMLKGVSANIGSAHKRNAGFPSAMAANKIIAIGTTFGYLLLFDSKQLLRFFLPPPDDCGGISALSLNVDASRVLAGHERGTVNMWDTDSGKVLRTFSYMANIPVLHIKFTDDSTKALMSNSAGYVLLMSFRRPLGYRVCDFRPIFAGADVVSLEPLIISNNITNHPLNVYNPFVIALATLSKFIVVILRPKLAKIFSYSLEGHSSTLPVISWQFIKLQVNQSSVSFDPVVLFGRDSKIIFALLKTSNTGATGMRVLKTLNLGYSLTNLIWFNNKTIAVPDQKENLHLVDIQSEEVIETLDLQSVQLVYSTAAFKGLAADSKNNPALVSASGFACYYSLTMASRQLLLLGQQSLHVFVIRTWYERVNVLKKARMYSEAVYLSREVFQGTCKAVVGALGPEKLFLLQSTTNLLTEYSSYAINSAPQQGSVDALEVYYSDIVPLILETCCLFQLYDFTNDIYNIFEHDITARTVFLSSIQSCVLSDRISKVSPSILKDLINQNIDQETISLIQDIILKLDISTIDIDQVVKLSWQNKLFDAIIYLYNRAIKNYSMPLEELTQFLRTKDSKNRQLVNTILVYLSCCMTGRDYIFGNIPEQLCRNAKIQSWKFLLFDQPNLSPSERFPNSKLLLLSDTREFLNVLSIAFGEPEFLTAEGQRVRQRIIDMVMLIVDLNESEFASTQLGSIYVFLARELMKSSLNLEPEVFSQVVNYLTSTKQELKATKIERERVVTELLINGVLSIDDVNLEEKLLTASFYSVLEFVYEKRGEYHKMLRCFCQVSERNKVVFRFVRSVLYQLDHVTEEQKQLLISEINQNISLLIQIDPMKAANLLLVELKLPVERVTRQLSVDHDSLVVFQFLSGVVELIARDKISILDPVEASHSISHETSDVVASPNLDQAVPTSSRDLSLPLLGSSNDNYSSGNNTVSGSQWARTVVGQYMRLAAVLDVDALEKFVRQSPPGLLTIEDAMQVCQSYKLGHIEAYVHVRAGNHIQAMKTFVTYVDNLISRFLKYDSESELGSEGDVSGGRPVTFVDIESVVNKCAKLLREMIATYHVNEKYVQDSWFSLLDAVVTPVKGVGGDREGAIATSGQDEVLQIEAQVNISDKFKNLLFSLLNSMIGYISLPSILTKVFADSAYDSGTYDDVRHLVTGMFETCRYESTLLTITSQLLDQDIFSNFLSLKISSNKGTRPMSSNCGICFKKLRNGVTSSSSTGPDVASSSAAIAQLAVFQCRHSYHVDCLNKSESWEESVVDNAGLPEVQRRHICLICKSRKDPNFETRQCLTTPVSQRGLSTSFHSEDGSFAGLLSRQKSVANVDSDWDPSVTRAFDRMYRSKRIVLDDGNSENLAVLNSAPAAFGRFRSSNNHHQSYSSYSYSSTSSYLDASLKLNLKPKRIPDKGTFDSND